MEPLAVFAMNLGLFGQNYAEWRAGGPLPPTRFIALLRVAEIKARVRLFALVLVSLSVLGASMIALAFDLDWLISTISAALIANASFQLIASVWMKKLQPGTVSGLVLMLPTAIWAIVAVDFSGGWIAFLAGPILSFPTLFLSWRLSVILSARLFP